MNTQSQPISRSVIKKNDSFFAYYFYAQIAYWIVRLVARTRLTPNVFTASSLILGILAAVAGAQGSYPSLLLAILLLNISFILDCVDGQLARGKHLSSLFGQWFDIHSDRVKDVLLLLGFAIGYMNEGPNRSWILVVTLIALGAQFLRTIATNQRDLYSLQYLGKKDELRSVIPVQTRSQVIATLRYSSLFKIAERIVMFTVFGALHKIEIGIILYASVDVIYSFASAALNYSMFYKHDKKNA